jgi:magnesium-transporting ATPase (P-type)
MNRLVFGLMSFLTLTTFLFERYIGWYAPESGLSYLINPGLLRLAFFLFFFIQMLLPLYHWIRDPHFIADALSGVLIFSSVVAAAFAFFIYNLPLLALNALARLAQLCLNS